jgi:NAD(P)H dehydrogenase (quinone)
VAAPRIGVTGASGAVGGRVARALADAGAGQRLVVRSASRAPQLPGAEVAEATYGDREATLRALDGLDVVLMVSAAEEEHRLQQHLSFVEAAVDAGVRHLVYTSFVGASPDAVFTLGRDHGLTEAALEESAPAWTFLRDNLYADFMPMLAGEDGVIRGPAGEGRLSAVARDDVAAVAVRVLLDPAQHERRAYALTGPEALTLAETAAVMTEVLGRPFSFHDETVEEAYASRAVFGAPQWQLDAWVSTYTAIRSGEMAAVSDDVERLTGRPATALRDLLPRL